MKRIATMAAIITAFAVAPSVATAGNVTAQVSPQMSAQVISAQVVSVQTWRVQRATAAISVQRHLIQIKQARRLDQLRALLG